MSRLPYGPIRTHDVAVTKKLCVKAKMVGSQAGLPFDSRHVNIRGKPDAGNLHVRFDEGLRGSPMRWLAGATLPSLREPCLGKLCQQGRGKAVFTPARPGRNQ